MATTRLRRTFHYPSDSDDPPDLDEEHQETLLHELETRDTKTSTHYRKLFLALPLLTLVNSILNTNIMREHHAPTATPLQTSASAATALFLTLLQIAVPALAAYILLYHPITDAGTSHGFESLYASSIGKSTQAEDVKANSQRLVVLGLSLSGLLVILAAIKWSSLSTSASPAVTEGIRRSQGEYGEIGNLVLPAAVFFLTLFVRQQLAPVDLQELREARYGLKGA